MLRILAAIALCAGVAACAVPPDSSYGPSYDSAGIHVDGGATNAQLNSFANRGSVYNGLGAGGGGGGGHH